MPIYEFQCQQCEHIWDELRKISDPIPEACPSCAASKVEQRMTAAGFRLKGGGWYETDFKSGSDTKRNLVESTASSDDSSSSGTSGSGTSGSESSSSTESPSASSKPASLVAPTSLASPSAPSASPSE